MSQDGTPPNQDVANLAHSLGQQGVSSHNVKVQDNHILSHTPCPCRQRFPLFVSQDGTPSNQDVANLAHSLGQQGVCSDNVHVQDKHTIPHSLGACRQRFSLFVSQDGTPLNQDVANLAHSLGQQGM